MVPYDGAFAPIVAATTPTTLFGTNCASGLWTNPRDRADLTVREGPLGARTVNTSSLRWRTYIDAEDYTDSATHAQVQDISRNIVDGMLSIDSLERTKTTVGDVNGDGHQDIV